MQCFFFFSCWPKKTRCFFFAEALAAFVGYSLVGRSQGRATFCPLPKGFKRPPKGCQGHPNGTTIVAMEPPVSPWPSTWRSNRARVAPVGHVKPKWPQLGPRRLYGHKNMLPWLWAWRQHGLQIRPPKPQLAWRKFYGDKTQVTVALNMALNSGPSGPSWPHRTEMAPAGP